MGAVRLGANTGFGMGRSLGLVGPKLCCCVFVLGGGALGCKTKLFAGPNYLLSEKEEEWGLGLGKQN